MSASVLASVNLQDFDITLRSLQFGTFSFRNYGEAGVSCAIEPLDENLYNEKLGAFGDMMISKNYKGRNKLLRVQLLRNSPDYARLQGVIAAEEAGQSIIFAVTARDSRTEESYTSPAGVLKVIPKYEMGSDVDGDVEFTILMSNVVHFPPKINIGLTSGV